MPNNVELHLDTDHLACDIANKFQTWESAKQDWYNEYMEVLQYVYATDTKKIMTQKHDWNNSTHIPKLTQIADVLRTYYLESIFSLKEPIEFDNYNSNADELQKKRAIHKFTNKVILERTNFKPAIRKLVDDYIYAGNAFISPVWDEDFVKNKEGMFALRDNGIRFMRINPCDIVFDATARDFKSTPKIIRSIMSIADVATMAEYDETMKKAFQRAIKNRSDVRSIMTSGDTIINNQLNIAGFGSVTDYYASDMMEVLTFFGDIFDMNTNQLKKARKITVVDRTVLLADEDMPSIFEYYPIFQTRWRDRVDNLWGMSPLVNLLGMQYRVDYLENKRADVYDFLSDPMFKTKGDVVMPEVTGPGAEFNCPIDGDINMMVPDTNILMADTLVDRYNSMMDLMAGTPLEAIGFRTPGEKTMFEVSQLQNASSRIFTRQVRKFEEELIEPALNYALQLYADKNKNKEIVIEDLADDGTPQITKIMAEDLVRPGALRAVGSINYADKAVMLQTLQQLGNSNIFMDEAVRANFSPQKIGYMIAYATGLDKIPGLFKKDSRLYEVTEQTKLSERLMEQVDKIRADSIINQQQAAQDARELASAGVTEEDLEAEEE